MTTPTWTYESSMAPHEDSPGGSTFEVLPLTPPRPNLKPGGAPPLSPRFSPPARVRTGRDLFSHSQPILPPSPLGSPARAHQSSLGGSRLSKTPTAPSSLAHSVAPPEREREYAREAFGRSSSFNENRNVASPRADEKPPIPIFSRVGSFRSASLTRSLSSKDASAPHTLDRLLSMEKGENWRWSQNEDGNRNDIWSRNASYNSELDDEVLENRGQLDGTWNVWRILKYGSPAIKKLLILIALTFSYSTTEFLFGLFTGRIGLVSDAFHLTFGCGVLTFSLFAMVYSKARPDERYTYGYNRLEVLSAFTNALFLLFLSFSLAVEALHAFVQDESEHKHYLIISAVANMIVNLLGVLFFRKYTRVRVVYRKAEDMNNHAICLHVLSDSIRSAGVVLASWFLALGVKYAETLCLGLVAVVVFLTTVPLFKASGGVLLQMAPTGISHSALSKCQRQVTLLEEVIECYKARFWDIAPGSVVGTLVIQIKAGTDEQKILKHVHSVYNDVGVKDLTVQLEIQQCCG